MTTANRKPRRTDVPAVPADAAVLCAADLAGMLRTTPRQIGNMVARGQCPAPVKVSGLGLRWSRAVIDAWLAEQLAA